MDPDLHIIYWMAPTRLLPLQRLVFGALVLVVVDDGPHALRELGIYGGELCPE